MDIDNNSNDALNVISDQEMHQQLSFEQKKNAHLLRLLSDLRSSDSAKSRIGETSQSDLQLERTYKKALSDFVTACDKLEQQTALCSKHSSDLRNRLSKKEDKADRITQTLIKYREDVARQSSFANNKPFDMERFEKYKLTSQALDDDLERERLRNTTHEVDISQLKAKIKKKNESAGGVSHIEYHHLVDDLKKSDDKVKTLDTDLKRNTSNKRNLLNMESTLQQQISSFQERNAKTVEAIKALDCEIEKKRAHLSRLESAAKLTKKRVGYDAAEIGAFLKLRVINDDFASSKEEIARLHAKLNELHCSYLSLSEGACDQ